MTENSNVFEELWDEEVDEWEFRINLMVQDDNEFLYWLDHLDNLKVAEVYDPKIEKEIQEICIKISNGYIKRYQKELSIVIPTVIATMTVKYLFAKPCIYDEKLPWWFDVEGFESKEWYPILDCIWKRKYDRQYDSD